MKPAPFAYVRAASLDQVFDLLARYGEDARVLAGGQSLIPTLNLRLSAPALLIDINGLEELAGIAVEDGDLRIGALTRQRTIEQSGEIARHGPLLHMAMPYIAHPAVRNRGTIGGSIRPVRHRRHRAARDAGADPARSAKWTSARDHRFVLHAHVIATPRSGRGDPGWPASPGLFRALGALAMTRPSWLTCVDDVRRCT